MLHLWLPILLTAVGITSALRIQERICPRMHWPRHGLRLGPLMVKRRCRWYMIVGIFWLSDTARTAWMMDWDKSCRWCNWVILGIPIVWIAIVLLFSCCGQVVRLLN